MTVKSGLCIGVVLAALNGNAAVASPSLQLADQSDAAARSKASAAFDAPLSLTHEDRSFLRELTFAHDELVDARGSINWVLPIFIAGAGIGFAILGISAAFLPAGFLPLWLLACGVSITAGTVVMVIDIRAASSMTDRILRLEREMGRFAPTPASDLSTPQPSFALRF